MCAAHARRGERAAPGSCATRDRAHFVITRALVRTQLSRYGPTAPGRLALRHQQHQCPFVDAQAGTPPLHFNLSHTDGLVALAVTRGHRVGVDVEA